MKFVNIKMYQLDSVTYWIGITDDGIIHMTMDDTIMRPVFSRKTTLDNTWSFFTTKEMNHYVEQSKYYGQGPVECYEYFIIHDDTMYTISKP